MVVTGGRGHLKEKPDLFFSQKYQSKKELTSNSLPEAASNSRLEATKSCLAERNSLMSSLLTKVVSSLLTKVMSSLLTKVSADSKIATSDGDAPVETRLRQG